MARNIASSFRGESILESKRPRKRLVKVVGKTARYWSKRGADLTNFDLGEEQRLIVDHRDSRRVLKERDTNAYERIRIRSDELFRIAQVTTGKQMSLSESLQIFLKCLNEQRANYVEFLKQKGVKLPWGITNLSHRLEVNGRWRKGQHFKQADFHITD